MYRQGVTFLLYGSRDQRVSESEGCSGELVAWGGIQRLQNMSQFTEVFTCGEAVRSMTYLFQLEEEEGFIEKRVHKGILTNEDTLKPGFIGN